MFRKSGVTMTPPWMKSKVIPTYSRTRRRTEYSLIVSEEGHAGGTRDRDPEGQPSAFEAKVWFHGFIVAR